MYSFIWTDAAVDSYNKEIDFILQKWNTETVIKFIDIVDDFLKTLETVTLLGKVSKKKGIYISVLSKQTSLAYKVDVNNKEIYLVLFWNNKQNPKHFEQFIGA